MVRKHFNKALSWIERHRFVILLFCTLLTMVLPSFFGRGKLYEIISVIAISFLFIQSMVAANIKKSHKLVLRYIVLSMIIILWLKPVGFNFVPVEIVKLVFFIAFFVFVMGYLIRFIINSESVDKNVLITSINIYLLAGIVGASLCFLLYHLYPNAYNLPDYINPPIFANFLYYSFITLSTVGYGEITPRIPETMTLAYIISIFGQLYVAIIIALLTGKYLMHSEQQKQSKS